MCYTNFCLDYPGAINCPTQCPYLIYNASARCRTGTTGFYCSYAQTTTSITTSTSTSSTTSIIPEQIQMPLYVCAYGASINSSNLYLKNGCNYYIFAESNNENIASNLLPNVSNTNSMIGITKNNNYYSDEPALYITGIGINPPKYSKVETGSYSNASYFTFFYNITTNNTFTVLEVACGNGVCKSISFPSSCKIIKLIGNSTGIGVLTAICENQSYGIYKVNGELSRYENVSTAAYTFSNINYSAYVNRVKNKASHNNIIENYNKIVYIINKLTHI